jgi:ribonuclease R
MEFDGVITGVIMKGIFVEMNENKCEGLVNVDLLGEEDFIFDEKQVRLTGFRTGKKFQMGDKVRVRVLSADIALRRIDLEFVV